MQITRKEGLEGNGHAICRCRFERICSFLGGDLQGAISARLLACSKSMCLSDSDLSSDEQSLVAYVGCGSMRLLIRLLLDYRFVQSVLLVSRPFLASPLSFPASIHSQSMSILISSYFLPIINPVQLRLRSPPSPQAKAGRDSLPIFSCLSQSHSYSVMRLWFSSGVATMPSLATSHFTLCSRTGCVLLQKTPSLVLIITYTSLCPSPARASAATAVMAIIWKFDIQQIAGIAAHHWKMRLRLDLLLSRPERQLWSKALLRYSKLESSRYFRPSAGGVRASISFYIAFSFSIDFQSRRQSLLMLSSESCLMAGVNLEGLLGNVVDEACRPCYANLLIGLWGGGGCGES